jgi:hypothetical protein
LSLFAAEEKTGPTDNMPPPGFTALFSVKDLSGWQGLVELPQRSKLTLELHQGITGLIVNHADVPPFTKSSHWRSVTVPSRNALRATFLILAGAIAVAAEPPKSSWWPKEVEEALTKAGDNRTELEKALSTVPPEQRKAMAFLIANMPDADLESLTAPFLLTNTALAFQARHQVPWGKDVPD